MNCRFYRQTELRWRASRLNEAIRLFPFNRSAKGAGTLRRAVRSEAFGGILCGRHMECAYYFDFCRQCQQLDWDQSLDLGLKGAKSPIAPFGNSPKNDLKKEKKSN